MAKNTRVWSDLDLNFIAHPVTGDVSIKTNEEAIKQSIRTLIFTNNYERPFRSEIGTPVRNLLFELANPMTKVLLERTITNTIESYEPRVNLISVEVGIQPDFNSVYITIIFKIINTENPITVSVFLERTR